jgi:hypothetical protein
MLHGHLPWKAASEYELVLAVTNQPLQFFAEINLAPISANSKSFIRGCLGVEEKNRFSWE